MSATIGLTAALTLLGDVGITRPSASAVARIAACGELIIAAAVAAGSELGSAMGIAALTAFTALMVIAIRRGSQAPCGCLGDVGSGRVGLVPIVRNVLLASAILAAWGPEASLKPDSLATAAGTVALLVVVPEALQTVAGLREARRRAVLEN